MTEARTGRLLAASLHEAILDVLPQRLEFYEHWLHSEGLRDGSIGLAPIVAVLGFLRTEGDAYDRVVTRAGSLAAEWTLASMTPLHRRVLMSLPRALRVRAALRVAAGIVRSIYSASRTSARVRRQSARLDVKPSLFCAVRESQKLPLCGFYAALATSTLTSLRVPAIGRVERCRAVEGSDCVITLDLAGADKLPGPAVAA